MFLLCNLTKACFVALSTDIHVHNTIYDLCSYVMASDIGRSKYDPLSFLY